MYLPGELLHLRSRMMAAVVGTNMQGWHFFNGPVLVVTSDELETIVFCDQQLLELKTSDVELSLRVVPNSTVVTGKLRAGRGTVPAGLAPVSSSL